MENVENPRVVIQWRKVKCYKYRCITLPKRFRLSIKIPKPNLVHNLIITSTRIVWNQHQNFGNRNVLALLLFKWKLFANEITNFFMWSYAFLISIINASSNIIINYNNYYNSSINTNTATIVTKRKYINPTTTSEKFIHQLHFLWTKAPMILYIS